MKFLPIIFSVGVLAAETLVRGQQRPAVNPILNALTSHGCYKSKASLKDPGGYEGEKVSSGLCGDVICNKTNSTVLGLRGTTCYCGFEYPPKEDLVEDKFCNYACQGYPFEACGSVDGVYYSIFNTGVKVDVDSAEPVASTSSKGASSPTSDASTGDEGNKEGDKKSTNVGGIVGGVVVGVVIAAAAIGGVFFYLRRKRNKEIEEEHRRNAAVNSFIGHKPPSSSGGLSITDARLDPVMQRRMSDGSIADNHDYSRKILRVTNA
ncbi:unnamed protein product [Parascedosporium putredinis]|uniref:WSC domain-containing protein n=1 Tax=Parascedosporium putredinis TaxID=1442378 RepID=A0A9P1H145_9PEZI|nr:unnamed protein product [Parascedosporium putredinis]CAI7994781.1 unnamed protein product [Parascedosporium putredinis]